MRLRIVGLRLRQRLRRGRDRGNRRPQLVRDVGHEAAPHRLVAFERRHVAQDPDGDRARSGRKRSHSQLPGHLVLSAHHRVGRSPPRDRLLERAEEGTVSEDLDERSSSRVRRSGHGPKAAVRVDHPVLRVDDGDAVGKRLENRFREPVLSLDPGHGFQERTLHAGQRRGQLQDLGRTALGRLPREVSARDRERRVRDVADRAREPGDGDAPHEDEQRAGGEHGAAEDPLVLGLDLAEIAQADRHAQHGRVRATRAERAGQVEEVGLERGRVPDRRPVARRPGGDDFRTARVVLHPGHFGPGDVGVVQHAAVGGDDGDPRPQEAGSAAHELRQRACFAEPWLDLFGEEVDLAAEPVTGAVLDGAVRDGDRDRGESEREPQREQREQKVQAEGEAHGS